MITAQVVLINKEGLVLGVSRKTNHCDFGLPGGKMDPEDNGDPITTAIREVKEETGLNISGLQLVFAIHKNGNMGFTYMAEYCGEINHNEPHVVKWLPFEVLINGSFGKYNQLVSESLDDMGIKYQKAIDKTAIIAELKGFIESTNRKGFQSPFWFDELHPNIGGCGYNVILRGNFNEGFVNDDYYDNKIKDIGTKHGLIVSIPAYYYIK